MTDVGDKDGVQALGEIEWNFDPSDESWSQAVIHVICLDLIIDTFFLPLPLHREWRGRDV